MLGKGAAAKPHIITARTASHISSETWFRYHTHLCTLELLQLRGLLCVLQQLLLRVPGVAVRDAIISLQHTGAVSCE